MTHQPPPGPQPEPGGMAEPCGHRRSVTLSGGPLVVAGVSGSPGSVHALRYAADLARRHGASLVPVLTWVPPCGDLDERKHPCLELRQLWEDDAWQLLWDSLGRAFGGLPAGLATQPVVRRGKPGKILAGLARRPGDILVVGAGRRGRLRRPAAGPGQPRRFGDRAARCA
jgi:nucleotide-binding universal stress UspA family protein